MDEHTRRMAELRLRNLPLQNEQGEPRELPNDCIEYLLSVFEWVYERGLTADERGEANDK